MATVGRAQAGAAMSGPLYNEARGDAGVPVPSVPNPTPSLFHFDWDATQASAEEGRSRAPGRFNEERDSQLAYAATQLAHETGQAPDAYYIPLYGEPTAGRPQVDEYHFWQDYAKQPQSVRDRIGVGKDRTDFDERLRQRFQGDKQARAVRSAKGGALGNIAGGIAGGLADPINQIAMTLPGFGEWWATKMLAEGGVNAAAETLETPLQMAEQKQQGGQMTLGEAAQNIGGAFAGGAALKGLHLAGGTAVDKALEASQPWRMAQALRVATPEGKVMPPDHLAAANVLERGAEIDATNPYQDTYTGIGTHREKLDQAQQAVAALPVATPGQFALGERGAMPAAAPVVPVPPRAGAGFLNQTIVDGLKARGLSDGQARGVAAGIHAESRGDPAALNRDGGGAGALGIGQWRGDRQAELHRRYGANPSLDQQLDFLAWELHGGDPGGAHVLAESDPARVLQTYIRDFMRPLEGPQTERDLAVGMDALGREGEAAPAEAAIASAEPPAPPPELAEPPALQTEAPPPAPLAEEPAAGVLGERPPEPALPGAGEEPLAVRDQVMRDGLVPVVRQLVGDRSQSLANVPRLAEDLGVSPGQLHRALEELVTNGELTSNREALRLEAVRNARAANAASGAKRKGTEKITVRAAPIDESKVVYRRKPASIARGPDDMLQFIARQGGISEDGLNEAGRNLGTKGHDLKETHQQFVPGHGPLIRKAGHSLDDMGEKLWDAGYFGPPDVTPRPTENDVLTKINQARAGGKIYSFHDDAPQAAPKASDFVPPDPAKIAADTAHAADWETWDPVARALGIPDNLTLREIAETREIMARGIGDLPPFEGVEATATAEELAPYLQAFVNSEIGTGNRAVDEDLNAGAIDTEDHTYEHYAAAASAGDAAADRGGSGQPAPEAPAPREALAGQPGDTGDARAGESVAGAGQAGAVPGGERLPGAQSPELPGARNPDGRTSAEQDLAEAAGELGPQIIDEQALKQFDDPGGEGVAKAGEDAWHDIRAAREAAPKPAKRAKGDENPVVRRGDRITVSEDTGYLKAGESYTIDRGNKKEAYFQNERTGAGTHLQNWQMKQALEKGHITIEPPEAPTPAAEKTNMTLSGRAENEANGYTAADVPPMTAGMRATVERIDGNPGSQETILGAIERGLIPDGDMLANGSPRWALEKGFADIGPTESGRKGRITDAGRAKLAELRGEAPPAEAAPPRLEPPAAEPAAAGEAAPPPTLDLGEQVDPNLAAKQRQELDLAAQQPLRGGRKTGAAQEETLPEGLFGGKIEPELLDQLSAKGHAIDLGDGKGLRPVEEIDAELEAEAKAIDTIESCLFPMKGGAP
jgi:hypothetical protein